MSGLFLGEHLPPLADTGTPTLDTGACGVGVGEEHGESYHRGTAISVTTPARDVKRNCVAGILDPNGDLPVELLRRALLSLILVEIGRSRSDPCEGKPGT
jgi:hypothetical protein